MAKPDFRATAARRLSEERELSPAIISLLSSEGGPGRGGIRMVPLDRIDPNPDQPRLTFDEEALNDLAASVREHGILQPILVRPWTSRQYQLVAGERRWRAARLAGLPEVPAIVEEINDETALEIAIIENLQREDLSPLDEAIMFDRMTSERGYSVRKLAQKLGKDKGYIENRLRLADAPAEIKQLVSLRKDTLSHASELLKVEDPRKRRRLAEQVARGELSLVKLRQRIEGRPVREHETIEEASPEAHDSGEWAASSFEPGGSEPSKPAFESAREPVVVREDSLVSAKGHLTDALDELVEVLRAPGVRGQIAEVDRSNLAKYLTISKLKLENAITLLRTGDSGSSDRH
ncbi:hypothetical protein BH20CHL6_BH20CHL6_07910 [soil metagenome]